MIINPKQNEFLMESLRLSLRSRDYGFAGKRAIDYVVRVYNIVARVEDLGICYENQKKQLDECMEELDKLEKEISKSDFEKAIHNMNLKTNANLTKRDYSIAGARKAYKRAMKYYKKGQ